MIIFISENGFINVDFFSDAVAIDERLKPQYLFKPFKLHRKTFQVGNVKSKYHHRECIQSWRVYTRAQAHARTFSMAYNQASKS